MWYLKNAKGEIFYLKPNKTMIVSRKEGHDIVLRDDASISKLHASITVRPKINFKDNEPSSAVILQDTKSKYGTFVTNSNYQRRKITNKDVLNDTDRITFGLQHHTFTIHYVPIIVSISTLDANEKIELKNIIDTLDGVIVDQWKDYCTHLTVSNVTLTAQVVQALAFGTQIVSLKYWQEVSRCVETNTELPDIENFIPSINEGLIDKESVSLKINPQRKVLFKRLDFICFSNSQYKLKDIIECAGGTLKVFNEDQMQVNHLCSEHVIVLQLENSVSQPLQTSLASYDAIQKALQKKKLRLIPESEVLLAILYCSIEKYCNPKFNFKQLLNTKGKTKNLGPSPAILALDTEDILSTTQFKTAAIINESMESSELMEETENMEERELLPSENQKNEEHVKNLHQFPVENKKSFKKPITDSEKLFRKSVTIINETGLSIDSDNDEISNERNDFSQISKKPVGKKAMVEERSSSHPFNIQTKLKMSALSAEENVRVTRTRSTQGKFDNNLFSNPSTSKDTPNKLSEDEESVPGKWIKKIPIKMTTSANVTDNRNKRNKGESDMFSFINEGVKTKRTTGKDKGNDLFELLEDPSIRKSQKTENIFEKELKKIKGFKNQKKRANSVSSDEHSSDEEETPKVKVEMSDSDREMEHMPWIQCEKEDTLVDEKCKLTTLPLFRSDIDLSLDNTKENTKPFVKMYTAIPKKRIKFKNMYVWKSEIESDVSRPREEESSSSDEDNNFRFQNDEISTKVRRRK